MVEIGLSARFDHVHILLHDHVLRTGLRLDRSAALDVIRMGMADENDLDVAELESELFHAGADQRYVLVPVRIDQNQTLRCRDQVFRSGLHANVVDIARYLERWKWHQLIRSLRLRLACQAQQHRHRRKQHQANCMFV